jgi:hypothetical protein
MSVKYTTISYSNTDATIANVTPALTIEAAIRSNLARRAGFVKSTLSLDNHCG